MKDGEVVISAKLETKSFEQQIKQAEDNLTKLVNTYERWQKNKGFNEDSESARKLATQIEKAKNKLVDLKAKQEELKEQNAFDKLKSSSDTLVNGMNRIIGKVGKWALAVFGVRSAYNLIRQSVSTLAQYDDKLASDLEYMRYALASAMKPIVDWLIKAAYKLLGLLGGIIKLFTGKNIFDNSGIKDYNKAVKSGTKATKELKKQLAGFDELNVLQDTSSSGGGVGGGTPGVDLKSMVDSFKGSDLDSFFAGVEDATIKARTGLAEYQQEMWNLISNDEGFAKAYGSWSTFVIGIAELWTGLVDIVAGVWDTIQGLIEMFIDIIQGDWDGLGEHWKQFITGLGEILMGAIEVAKGLVDILVGFVRGIFTALGRWLDSNIIKPIGNWFANLGKGIADAFKNAWQWTKDVWSGAIGWFSNVGNGIKNVFTNIVRSISNVFSSLWSTVKTTVNNIFEGIKQKIIEAINFIIDNFNSLVRKINEKLRIKVPDGVPGIGGKEWSVNIKEIPRLARGGILNNPGAGVFTGNAIGGEAGPEAYIPLNDDTLDKLGTAIARHMVINATMVNQMNGRTISRELQTIMNEQDFSYNR